MVVLQSVMVKSWITHILGWSSMFTSGSSLPIVWISIMGWMTIIFMIHIYIYIFIYI